MIIRGEAATTNPTDSNSREGPEQFSLDQLQQMAKLSVGKIVSWKFDPRKGPVGMVKRVFILDGRLVVDVDLTEAGRYRFEHEANPVFVVPAVMMDKTAITGITEFALTTSPLDKSLSPAWSCAGRAAARFRTHGGRMKS